MTTEQALSQSPHFAFAAATPLAMLRAVPALCTLMIAHNGRHVKAVRIVNAAFLPIGVEHDERKQSRQSKFHESQPPHVQARRLCEYAANGFAHGKDERQGHERRN